MRASRTILLGAVLGVWLPATPAMAADGWGASWSFGPVEPTSSNHLTYMKTTLVPGRMPAPYWSSSSVGPLFLWPGISNPTSNLIQTTMDAWSGTENDSYCKGNGSQWCVEASVFNGGQINGPTVAINPTDQVTIEYSLESDNNTWDQTVTLQGKVVSTLKSASGTMPGGGLGFATEADANSFTVDNAYYLCTEVHLAAADPNFGSTGVGGAGAQYGATGTGSGPGTVKNLRTPDKGLTWLVDLITLPAMSPQGTQTPPPAIDCTADAGTGSSSSSSSTSSTSRASSSSTSSTSESSSSSASTGGRSESSSTTGATGASTGVGSGSATGAGTGVSSGSASRATSGSQGTATGSNGARSASSGGGTGSASGASSSDDATGNSSGCSCGIAGAPTGTAGGLSLVALGVALTVARRRRRI